MQVGCNLRADPFDGNRASDPRAVDDECQGARAEGREGEEPSALPERRQHRELDRRGIGHRAVGEDRAHEKAVAPRRGTGERNRACVRNRPVTIHALELMPVPQPVCGLCARADEIDLEAAIAGLDREPLEPLGAVSPGGQGHAADADAGNQCECLRMPVFGRCVESRHALRCRHPDSSRSIAKSSPDFSARYPIVGRVVREPIRGGIEPVDATSGRDKQGTRRVLHDDPRRIT